MTVPNEVPRNDYVANGGTTKFSVLFDYETISTLKILVNDVEPTVDKYYFDAVDSSFNFYQPPKNGDAIRIYRETPKERDIDYDDNYNSFRPKTLNKDFDRIWRVIQEYLSALDVNNENLEKEILDRIKADKDMFDYIMNQDNSLKQDYISRDEILKRYVDQLIALITDSPSFDGVDAEFVKDESGETQQQVNYNGGSKWHSRVDGYQENERVVLANGDIVKSTIDGNTNDPNVDMTGWVKTNAASQIFDESGKTQQQINDSTGLKTPYVTPDMFTGSDDQKFHQAVQSGYNILVPARDYTFTNTDYTKMLVVNGSKTVRFEKGTRIFFASNAFPVFACVNGDNGGLVGDCEFIYTGTSQLNSTVTVQQFKDVSGVVNFPYLARELHSVILRVNCNNHRIADYFKFRSETDDISHGIIFCINDKGDGPTQKSGNKIGKCDFENCVFGLLTCAQKNFSYYGPFTSQKRWGVSPIAPGHVVYLTGGVSNGFLEDGFVGDISDFGNELNFDTEYNLATLAPKGCKNVTFGDVYSNHFSGIFQTLDVCDSCSFGNIVWDYQGTVQSGAPQFNVGGSGASNNITLPCVVINSPNVNFRFLDTSVGTFNNSTVNMQIKCSQVAAITLQLFRMHGKGNTINVEWTPVGIPTSGYMLPFEEPAFVESTGGNVLNLTLRGSDVVPTSERIILRKDTSKSTVNGFFVDRSIQYRSATDLKKNQQVMHRKSFTDRKSGVIVGDNTYTFNLPDKGSFIVSVSAQNGNNGTATAFIVCNEPTLGFLSATKIAADTSTNDSSTPNVKIPSASIASNGDLSIILNSVNTSNILLNVTISRIGILY